MKFTASALIVLGILIWGTSALVREGEREVARLDACLEAGFARDVAALESLHCDDFDESVVMKRKHALGLDDYGQR